jgi:hypothetical protein
MNTRKTPSTPVRFEALEGRQLFSADLGAVFAVADLGSRTDHQVVVPVYRESSDETVRPVQEYRRTIPRPPADFRQRLNFRWVIDDVHEQLQ